MSRVSFVTDDVTDDLAGSGLPGSLLHVYSLRRKPIRMSEARDFGFETRMVHAGHIPDSAVGARAVPIYQTTSYVFFDTDHAADLFDLKQYGHIYSRISNPTVAVLEE